MWPVLTDANSRQWPGRPTYLGLLALVAGLTSGVLLLTAEQQIFDTNFYTLWEATALLAGDHPYRDFYEWGVPLQAFISAIAQFLVGYRLIGEFLVHWLFIVAGVLIAFHLGLRLSRSVAASLVTTALALPIVASTPTFHYPKLFFYPLGVWLAWRYVERPTVRRGAALGAATAIAFLFRHDHGVYIAGVAVLAFVVARLAMPACRSVRSSARDAAAYAGTAAVIVAPWLIVVHMTEGLPKYVRLRADLYREWSASQSPYRTLLTMNPIRALAPEELAPTPAVVSFEWGSDVDDARRMELERRHGLRLLEGRAEESQSRYEVPNIYDVSLLELKPFITNTDGFEWERLEELSLRLPARDNVQMWLQQTALLVPLLLIAAAGVDVLRSWYRGSPVDEDTYLIVVAAAFLAAIDARLFREASYVVVVAPLTAGLSARLIAGRRIERGTSPALEPRFKTIRSVTRWILAVGMLLVTGLSVLVYARQTNIFKPFLLAETVRPAFVQLLASPPIDAYQPADAAGRLDRAEWEGGSGGKLRLLTRYVHDCTRAGDRVLVTGSTPYHVSYYVQRPIAGGQLFWHHRWRTGAVHEIESLTLLQSQSVPFALSTHDPVLDDFKSYPRIREYLATNYVELEGSEGLLLIDTRRRRTGTFGSLEFPCFR
jgi:hypothetical protein